MVLVAELLGSQKPDTDFQLLAVWCPNPCVIQGPTALALSLAELPWMASPPELFAIELLSHYEDYM